MPSGVYLAGKNATVTVEGTPMAITDGSYTTMGDVDEVTNLLSQGFYEDVGTTRRCTTSLRAVYNGATPPTFNEHDIVNLAIAVPGGPGIVGLFRINRMDYPVVDVKAAVRYNFDATSQGAYTKS
jgi:hypothetical protein